MAKFDLQLPNEIISEMEKIYNDSDAIFGGMTKAGAEQVEANVRTNIPSSFHGSNIMNCLRITKVYRTPSDGGINTKVAFYGYFINKNGKKVPAPLVCNVFEYGSSKFHKKHPFMRKSFNKRQIEQAMFEAQKKLSGGVLDE